jgi:hypothetical protein
MSDRSSQLAEKLMNEGERTLGFFRGLLKETWDKRIFEDGAQWTVREVFEHLIVSEESLRKLFAQVVAGGKGASESFDIDRFNREHTGRLASLQREDLFQRYDISRRQTVEFTRILSHEQLALRGRHPAMGDSSVEDMLKMVYLHHAMHVRDVKRQI